MNEKRLVLIPKLKIHNANALSSPYTIGFPAMTAWLGFVHALQRKLNQQGLDDLQLKSVAVISHQFDLQTYKGTGDFVNSLIISGNPSVFDEQYKKKYGSTYSSKYDAPLTRPSFVEDARVNLTVSLLIEYEGNEEELDEPEFTEQLEHLLRRMKVAGGDILSVDCPSIDFIEEHDDAARSKWLRQLMPGYALIERRELMEESMANGADALDAMLEYLTVNHSSELSEDGEVTWQSQRKTSGWIVPIATGFQGISELGEAKNQRDPDIPHRFAESVVTLGEFVMPYRIKNLDDMLWHYHADQTNNLYICQQNNRI